MPIKKNKYSLLVVAHPDDETLFFGGLLLATPHWNWKIICVTDGNSDGRGSGRSQQYVNACKKLGARNCEQWDFQDIYEKRIESANLEERLTRLEKPVRVFTHGILGEYGHPHHQDVSFVTHKVFSAQGLKVFSPAHNSFGSFNVRLSKLQFQKKTKILNSLYFDETKRFISLIPALQTESFQTVNFAEVREIYKFMTKTTSIDKSKIKTYKWMLRYLESGEITNMPRLF